jgi:hypothetical protein
MEFAYFLFIYLYRLHEDEWRLKHGPYNGLVTKEVMMVAFQNIEHILIRGTSSPEVLNATLVFRHPCFIQNHDIYESAVHENTF